MGVVAVDMVAEASVAVGCLAVTAAVKLALNDGPVTISRTKSSTFGPSVSQRVWFTAGPHTVCET